MKPNSIGDPVIYLGGRICPFHIFDREAVDDDILAMGISPTKYIKSTIDNVDRYKSTELKGFVKAYFYYLHLNVWTYLLLYYNIVLLFSYF